MAGRGISIDILANVRDALRGVGDVEQAISDVESTLEDMGRQGDESVDRMTRGFRDLARDADTSADKVERKYKDAYRDIARSADDAADSAVKSQRRMSERSAEVGQEIRQNLGEGIANAARGDFESLADTIGDTLGGTVAGIGGIATAAAGAAGALGIGAVVGAIQLAKQEQEKLNEEVSKWADAYQQSAGRIVSAAALLAEVQAIGADPVRYKEAQDAASEWGVSTTVAMRALAGDATALEVAERSLSERTRESNEQLLEQEKQVDGNAGAVYDMADQVDRGNRRLEEQKRAMKLGADQARDTARAMGEYARETGTATTETDDLGNKIYELPGGKRVVVDVKTGEAYEDLDAFEAAKLADKTATVNVGVKDNTPDSIQRIVKRINNQVATIKVGSVATGFKTMQ